MGISGIEIREVVACDHVSVNRLILTNTQNFYTQGPAYIVIEEGKIKVVCPECLLRATKVS